MEYYPALREIETSASMEEIPKDGLEYSHGPGACLPKIILHPPREEEPEFPIPAIELEGKVNNIYSGDEAVYFRLEGGGGLVLGKKRAYVIDMHSKKLRDIDIPEKVLVNLNYLVKHISPEKLTKGKTIPYIINHFASIKKVIFSLTNGGLEARLYTPRGAKEIKVDQF